MASPDLLCYLHPGVYHMSAPAPINYYDDATRFWWPERDKVVSKQPFLGNFRPWEREYDPSMVISTPHSSIEHSHIQNTCSLSTYLPPTFSPMATSPIPISDYTWPASNYFVSPGNQTNTTPFIFNSPHQVVPTSISYTTPETPFVSSSHVTQLPSSTFHTATLTTQQPPNPIFSYQLSDANNEPTMFDERLERITSTRKVLVMDYSHDEDCLYCEDSSTQQQSITPAFINSQFQIPNHHSQLSISPSQFPTSFTNQLPQLPELKSSSMVTVDTKTQNIATADVSGTLVVGNQNLEVVVYGEAEAVRDGGEDIESGLDSVLGVQEGEVKATSKYENVDKEGICVESVICDNRKNVGVFESVKSDGDLEAARKGLTESKSEVPTCNVVEVFSLDIKSPIGEVKVKTMKEVNSKVGNLSDSFFSMDSHVEDVIGQYILLSLVQTGIKGCPFKINFDTAEKLPTMEAKYKGGGTCNVSPFTIEDGVSPPNIFNNREGLNIVKEAIGRTGYNERIKIAIDVVATDFGIDYPIVLIADPFDREDWEHVKYFSGLGVYHVVGDDLLMSNPKRIKIAIKEAACNALLLKVSQIGIATEFVEVDELIDQYPAHSKMESNEAVYLNTLISGYAQNRYDKEVIKLFCCMVEEDFRWNEHTSAELLILFLWIYYSMVIKDARQSAKDISNYRFMASKHKWSLWLLVSVFHFTIAIISSTIPIKCIEYDASMWKMEKKSIKTLKVTSFCDTFRRTLIEVIDTLSATKAAVKKRIGNDSEELEQLQIVNFDLKMGVQIIQNAFKAYVHAIASNARVYIANVLSKMLKQGELNLGYGTTPLVHAIASNARVYRANVLSKLLKQGELNLGYGTTPLVFDPGGVCKFCRFSLTMDDSTMCCIRTSKLTSKLGNMDRLQEVILEDKDCLKGEEMSYEAIKMELIFYFLVLVMHVSYAGIGHMSCGVISVTNLVRVRE